jgi:hypothetical protein
VPTHRKFGIAITKSVKWAVYTFVNITTARERNKPRSIHNRVERLQHAFHCMHTLHVSYTNEKKKYV